MLPGFRFLFAAIVLSTSLLIFGLGATALLRAAHQEVASIPARRAPPEPVFAAATDPAPPTLALLRVEPDKVPEPVPVAPPIEPSLKPETPAPLEAAGPDSPASASAAQPAPEPVGPPAADQSRLAILVETPSTADAKPEEMPPPESSPAAATIATLGGPAVAIEGAVLPKPAEATPENGKPEGRRARRARHRQAAQRAARVAGPQQADPFGLPATR